MPNEKNTQLESQYTVVARRYRPQSFSDLVGQDQIATALSNAITQNRVGHAYLFTGARGVGKTSSARIFAKCLNCEQGPTAVPCNECDTCDAISTGEDVDVLEIDGASNRGIDEIRQLRSNAGVRPSRGRFKIYIIDEVHMLTQQAFNALLKTLEEPPEHVKFIFCTTDPQKIPITVLSRCQRFDFSPVQPAEITNRLKLIADNEGVDTEQAALELLARRAGGSMRDSQSLLEQLFSFCDDRLTVDDVHRLLGTADLGRVVELVTAMSNRDAAASLRLISEAISDGVDAGQLAEQLLAYYRDLMAARVGCDAENMVSCTEQDMDQLNAMASQVGLETILAAVQLIDGAIVKMQYSLHTRTLLEVSVVRICNLEQLESIGSLLAALESGKIPDMVLNCKTTSEAPGGPSANSKKNGPANRAPELKSPSAHPPAPPAATLAPSIANRDEPADIRDQSPASKPIDQGPKSQVSAANIGKFWQQCLSELGGITAELAADVQRLELRDPANLVVTLASQYNQEMCSRPDRKQKLEAALQRVAGRAIRIDFVISSTTGAPQSQLRQPKLTRMQQIRKLHEDPLIRQAVEAFDAEIVDFRKTKTPGD